MMQALLIAGNRSYKRAEGAAFARDKVLEEMTLGERKAKARLGDRAMLGTSFSTMTRRCLRSSFVTQNTEDDVLRLSSKRPNRPASLTAIALNYRWFRRGTIRRALLLNYAPLRISVSVLPLMSVREPMR